MKFKCVLLLAGVVFFSTGIAQTKKTKFNSINTAGIIIGQSGTSVLFETINGIETKKWFTGIGAGIDLYYYKSIPLFLDVRKYIDKQNSWLLYADAGYSIPIKNRPKEYTSYSSYHFTGGIYTDIGAGYRIKFNKNPSLLISGGYSYKNIHSAIGITNPCRDSPCPETINRYNYGLSRIFLKAGIQLK